MGNICSAIIIGVGSVLTQNSSIVVVVMEMVSSENYHIGQHSKYCLHAGEVTFP